MKKLLLAATAALAMASFALPAAQAGTSLSIAVGEPYPGYDPYPGYEPYPGYHPYPDYDDEEDEDDQISCWEGRRIVRSKGYRAVRPVKCSGSIYRYSALKAGRPWSVRINSYTGRVVRARPLEHY